MGEQLDLRSDIYAVGATLYFLLTGKLPYDADNAVRLIAIVMSGTPTPITTYRSDIPPALETVITRCLARKREDRFADYASLRAALEACQPVQEEAAPLLRRIAAGLIDSWLISMVVSAIFSIVKPADVDLATYAADPRLQLRQALLALPVELLWYGALEGLTGWSVGKWLLGLRVTREGEVPGVPRGLLRGLLIASPGLVGAVLSMGFGTVNVRSAVASAAYVLVLVLLFVRARKSNGFLGEHDRITGTRVVRRRVATSRHRSAVNTDSSLPVAATETAHLGPYDVSGALTANPNVLVGVDRTLRRPVWIVRHPVGTSAVDERHRQAIRAGTVRWIGGKRTDTEAWDAYAAPSGIPLRTRLSQPYEWREVHAWLADLVDELRARVDDGDRDADPSLDHVLITDEGHALVLPLCAAATHA